MAKFDFPIVQKLGRLIMNAEYMAIYRKSIEGCLVETRNHEMAHFYSKIIIPWPIPVHPAPASQLGQDPYVSKGGSLGGVGGLKDSKPLMDQILGPVKILIQ